MSKKKTITDKSIKSSQGVKKISNTPNLQTKWFWISAILLTFISFYPSLHCKFTSWDDPLYVTESNLIKNLSFDNIIKISSPDQSVASNYHPLTILSFAIDYHFCKLNPFHYHFKIYFFIY